jgi:hypothetical protein
MDSNMGSKDKRSRKVVLRKPGFSLRKLVCISAFFSFLGLGATGIALFTSPPGRIARWGSWRIAGLIRALMKTSTWCSRSSLLSPARFTFTTTGRPSFPIFETLLNALSYSQESSRFVNFKHHLGYT